MKIGQFGESFIPVFDGVGRVMKAYAETMTARGNEVYVVTPMYDLGYRGNLPYEIVDFTSVKLSRKLPWRVGIEQLDPHFTARISQIDLDICHVHGPAFAGHIGAHLAHKRNIPLVGTFHTKFYDDLLQMTGVKTIAHFGSNIIARFFERCDEVWSVSEGTGETLREYGYKGRLMVMPNGTNRRVLNLARVPEARERFGIRTDVPVLLFVGQISWKKNLRRTIEACALLKQQGIRFQLVLAGLGPDEEDIKALIKEKGLEDTASLTGHVTDVELLDALYSLATLFVFPSTYDNAPMVVREAAAQHTPTLAVEGSCTAEVITDMENGILSKDTSESVASAIKKYLDLTKDQQSAIGRKACETIPIPWDGPLMDRILERYQILIDEKKTENRAIR